MGLDHMIDWIKIDTTCDRQWLKSLIEKGVPINGISEEGLTERYITVPAVIRAAAMRLYELGEKDYAFNVLIAQMLQYKNPDVSKNTKYETCATTIIALGQLGEKRAIKYLIEAIDEFTNYPAFALALIDGRDLEKRLIKLSKTEGIRGFGATLALGFMKNKDILPQILNILEHVDEYQQKYRGKIMWSLKNDIMYMLGTYNDETARQIFIEKLEKHHIEHFIRDYVIVEKRKSYYKYTDLSTFGWEITRGFGWDKYLDTEEKHQIFSYTKPGKEITRLRTKIVEEIWHEIRKDDS